MHNNTNASQASEALLELTKGFGIALVYSDTSPFLNPPQNKLQLYWNKVLNLIRSKTNGFNF